MNAISKELQIAITAAKIGGKKALTYYNKNIASVNKSDNSVVTVADTEVEKTIKSQIKKSFPQAKFIAEESAERTLEDETWIIDPIDSTRNFARGIPLWSVLIAFYKNGEIVLGVCYLPAMESLLYAEKDKGAFFNEKPTFVSKIAKVKDALIGHQSLKRFPYPQELIALTKASGSSRGYESDYSNFLLATGHMDACLNGYGNLWDYAPFKVIIEEAGGKITKLDGQPWKTNDSSYFASNGLIHDEVVKLLNL
jgi:histidinol-phosphatase